MIFNLLNMHFKLKHDIRHVTCHMTYNCTIDKNKMDSILHYRNRTLQEKGLFATDQSVAK